MDQLNLKTYQADETIRNEDILGDKIKHVDELISSRKKRIESLSMIKSNLKNIYLKLS